MPTRTHIVPTVGLAAALLVLSNGAKAASLLADEALRKFEVISNEKVASGSTVSFSVQEVSAWVLEEQRQTAPSGVRNLTLSFGRDVAYFNCLVDLVALSASFGKPLDPLSAMLVEGQHSLRIGVAVRSGGGRAVLSLVQFDYDGGPAPDIIRQRMVSTFLSVYPQVKLNQPFPLSYNVDQVRLDPSGVQVSIAGDSVRTADEKPATPPNPAPPAASSRSLTRRKEAAAATTQTTGPTGPAVPAYPPIPPPPAPAAEAPESLLARGKDQFSGDAAGARDSFRKAADQGNVRAMVLLGAMYSQGIGGPKDDSAAVARFRQAAQLGYVRAMFNLGLMYEGERGVPKSPANQAEAAKWYAEAVNAGHSSDAAYRLGIMYEEGRGVPRDPNQAQRLYRMAGTPEAMARSSKMIQ